jgi:hypothetical protein
MHPIFSVRHGPSLKLDGRDFWPPMPYTFTITYDRGIFGYAASEVIVGGRHNARIVFSCRYRPAQAQLRWILPVPVGTGYRRPMVPFLVPHTGTRCSLAALAGAGRTRCSLAASAARLPHPLLACRIRCSLAAPAARLPHPLLACRIRCSLAASAARLPHPLLAWIGTGRYRL